MYGKPSWISLLLIACVWVQPSWAQPIEDDITEEVLDEAPPPVEVPAPQIESGEETELVTDMPDGEDAAGLEPTPLADTPDVSPPEPEDVVTEDAVTDAPEQAAVSEVPPAVQEEEAEAVERSEQAPEDTQENVADAVRADVAPAESATPYRARVYTRLPDTPEGIGVDTQGNLYASLFHTGQIVQLDEKGGYAHIAWIPSIEQSGKGHVLGLASDTEDNLYVAYKARSKYDRVGDPRHPACRDATDVTSGLYRIDAETREVTSVATRGDGWPFCFPDDVAVDDAGNVYLSDLTYAGIWKITPDGRVTLWSEHPLLHWSAEPYSGFPLGVNVIALDADQRNLYAATSGDPLVLRIPIQPDGAAGEPVVISRGHSLLDGITLDEAGNIYVSEIYRNEIVGISPDGTRRVVVANKNLAPLDGNASLVVRDGVLYVANLGFAHPRWQDADKTVVAIAGFPRP